MIRPILAATEYRLRSADEMEELVYAAVETYEDVCFLGTYDAHARDIADAVERNAAIIAARPERDRKLAAEGVL